MQKILFLPPHEEQIFLNILPLDWREEWLLFKKKQNPTYKIYGIKENDLCLGGGIIMQKSYPEKKGIRPLLDQYQKKNDPYLGFFWIHPAERKKGYGTVFLQKITSLYKKQNLWLVCNQSLGLFYQKNGFEKVDSWKCEDEPETQYLMQKEKTKTQKKVASEALFTITEES